jgi:hypothetical protein
MAESGKRQRRLSDGYSFAGFRVRATVRGVFGFVEGLNNKIRVFQRRAYGLRDEEYLRLKVLTCMLPPR